ncbi:flagellin [Frigidibacter oleivorans]|uniref:flagellin n=1 Tax=Frigidibacter oleivorans TaxID=2487129 RepID=UPI000F8C9E16|nr:flagellin [Frigidibacter oleivorans]
MSSILTNNGAMVALQTLKAINSDLEKTQSEISTGKTVASAKDNAAVWSISKVMESDVAGFQAISDSLALGESTVAVARQAAESITDLLTEMKKTIVAGQEENVDRATLQTDVEALIDQIESVISAAQFNGLNLVDGSASGATILSSLDRDSSGDVSASTITVGAQNLSTGDYTANDVFASSTNGTISNAADTFVLSLDAAGGTDTIELQDGTNAWAAGDKITLQIGGESVSYTLTEDDVLDADGDSSPDSSIPDVIALGLKNAIDALDIDGLSVSYDSGTPGTLSFTNDGTVDLTVSGQYTNADSGGLGALASIDVSTEAGATAALSTIETLIDTATAAASAFGSVEGRIETQADFVSKLTDAMKSGIGSLVDADMEEASARLQALQTQQQLGIQALSIANQQPQNILALFQ